MDHLLEFESATASLFCGTCTAFHIQFESFALRPRYSEACRPCTRPHLHQGAVLAVLALVRDVGALVSVALEGLLVRVERLPAHRARARLFEVHLADVQLQVRKLVEHLLTCTTTVGKTLTPDPAIFQRV